MGEEEVESEGDRWEGADVNEMDVRVPWFSSQRFFLLLHLI